MATATSRALPVARSEQRSHGSLLLELIALRHQIVVLKRSRTRRPCFRLIERLFWILLSSLWPRWRESLVIVPGEPRPSCARAATAGRQFGDIDQVAAGETGVRGFPGRFGV
jgi:hypothetical protein